jgi:RNA polymerase sigma-70 factor, ECF subfamily
MEKPGLVTDLLGKIKEGDGSAISQLFRVMNKELRSIAGNLLRNERPNHMLQPTALINELYLRLFAGQQLDVHASKEFYRLAARVMQHILIDEARRRNAGMRRGLKVQLEEHHAASRSDPDQMALLSLALRRLARQDARGARALKLYYFAELDTEAIAGILDVNVRTIERDLKTARLWLKRELTGVSNVAGELGES